MRFSVCFSLCFSFSFCFSFRVEAKQTSLEGVVEPMVEAAGDILMMLSLFLMTGAYGMLPYNIKPCLGSCADLREHQGTPLQEKGKFFCKPVGADSISARLYGSLGAYGMLPYNIKPCLGSRADFREHQGTPLQ